MQRFKSIIFLGVLLLLLACLSCKNKSAEIKTNDSKTSTVVDQITNTGHLYPFMNEARQWGYLDVKGNVAITPQFAFADNFSGGFGRVRVQEKWGYVDASGKIAIPPQFERARGFKTGIAAVRVNKKWGYINESGTIIVQPQFSKLAQSVAEGLAAVPDSAKKFGYVNSSGTIVIPHKFDNAHEFSEGLAAVELNEKWGFIDTTGKWVFEPQYVWADKFVEGHSLVRIGMQPNVDYALIDHKGDIKFRLQTLHCKTASDGLMRFMQNNKWGFIDATGKIVIPPKYEAAFDFSEGLAAVRMGNGWGYINAADQLMINVEHNVAEEFRGGIARVTWPGGKWGYIDKTGRKIWESAIPGTVAIAPGDSETGADSDD